MDDDRTPLWRPDALNVAARVPRTHVEGPGLRYALWLQGCGLRCPECCNPNLHPFVEREWLSVDALFAEIVCVREACTLDEPLEGITLLGGEPFAQAVALAKLARRLRAAGLSVLAFSGLSLATLREQEAMPGCAQLLGELDLLVDGPFLAAQHSRQRRFIGSDNQTVHCFGERYRSYASQWPRGDGSFELRLSGGQLSVNGEPRNLDWLTLEGKKA